MMPEIPELSEAKRVLREKYLRGEIQPAATVANNISVPPQIEQTDRRERVLAIQSGGTKRPFFFLHGQWKGDAFFCYPLAHNLGTDQPFYVLEPYNFDGLQIPPTFEDIAAAHLKSLRTVQSDGPYLLGGWCNGALLAYEMARQLHLEGQAIDLLILMDPMYLIWPVRPTYRLFHSVASHLGNLLQAGQDKPLDWYLHLRHVHHFMCHLQYLRYAHYRRSKPLTWGRQDYSGVYDWIAMNYAPSELYPGKITFFWSMKEPFRRGWRKVEETNEVEIHRLAGVHMTCFSEYLYNLAEHLRVCLSKIY